jgi:hypothetical protein
MKKLFVLWLALIVLAVGVVEISGHTRGAGVRKYLTDVGEKTIDSQYTGNWEPAESLVVVRSDSGYILVHLVGIAVLEPNEALYVGLGDDSANRVNAATAATIGQTHTNLDTFYFAPDPAGTNEAQVSINCVWLQAYSAGAKTDTFYLNMATNSSASHVSVKDVVMWAEPIEKDSI